MILLAYVSLIKKVPDDEMENSKSLVFNASLSQPTHPSDFTMSPGGTSRSETIRRVGTKVVRSPLERRDKDKDKDKDKSSTGEFRASDVCSHHSFLVKR